MKKTILVKFIILISLFLPNTSLASKISVGSIVVDFSNVEKNYIDIPIYNESKNEEAYVKVTVKEVIEPGTKKEKRQIVPKSGKNILIASPQKIVVPVNGKKNVRFISLHNDLKKDKIYRVHVAPVVGKITAKGKSFVKVLIAYDVLAIIRPKKLKTDFSVKRKGKKITFTSKANTNILIRKGKQCSKKNPKKCEELPGVRLYAGNKVVRDLPFTTPVDITYSIGDKIYTKTY